MLQSAPSSILAGDLEAHLHFLQKQLLDKGTKNYRLEKWMPKNKEKEKEKY